MNVQAVDPILMSTLVLRIKLDFVSHNSMSDAQRT